MNILTLRYGKLEASPREKITTSPAGILINTKYMWKVLSTKFLNEKISQIIVWHWVSGHVIKSTLACGHVDINDY